MQRMFLLHLTLPASHLDVHADGSKLYILRADNCLYITGRNLIQVDLEMLCGTVGMCRNSDRSPASEAMQGKQANYADAS